MKNPESVRDLFEMGLKYALDCEQQLIKALPKMSEASSSAELRDAFDAHLDQTREHAQRLEQIFLNINREADAEKNDVIRTMIKEGEKKMDSIEKSPLLDAALIVSGNEVEHYEMALYGSLRTFAGLLGNGDAARLLDLTLLEEKAADAMLTTIGETSVNRAALEVHANA